MAYVKGNEEASPYVNWVKNGRQPDDKMGQSFASLVPTVVAAGEYNLETDPRNPRYYNDAWLLEDSTRSAPHRDAEISQERTKCFRRLFPNHDDHRRVLDERVLDEYAMFSIKSRFFSDLTSISMMGTMEPKSWWVNFGAQTPFLQTLAFRLLGQPSSSSCGERNWSTYAFIHSLRKNKNPNDDVKMWDVGGDAFDSMEDVGFLEFADLSLDEPEFENNLIIDN
ncbi:HAT dimerization domain, Ribonuclease H-like domain protein [Artemisia annua]|uniref:HAT dimerization domain, Ribonuclease H-like domain protein n=1 Tax=Artemisia annua TaxID=35608 RepID=A0A2U1KX89_ARTAN|nr:HAT dimerization domain, Ribonuclease H-like domain protein [Artemisia annua]